MYSLFLNTFTVIILSCTSFSSPEYANALGVPITLQNNSGQTREVTLIWYSPFRFGNSTEQLTLAPGEQIKRRYAIGTKLYRATEQETEAVMGGGRIDDQEPFLKVKLTSRKEVFPLF